MPDVTGWSEDEFLDYEGVLAAEESLSAPRQYAYLDACGVAALKVIDEGRDAQWFRNERRRLLALSTEELVAYVSEARANDAAVDLPKEGESSALSVGSGASKPAEEESADSVDTGCRNLLDEEVER